MHISITAFLSYLCIVLGSARAQISAPNCTISTFAWSLNSLQQSPCVVGATLVAACFDGAYTVPALQSNTLYVGPGTYNPCGCNTVAYNLFSACDACQGSTWINYTVWSTNCTSTAGFPNQVPAGLRIPQWAMIGPLQTGNNWNVSVAQLVGGSPEFTGAASTVPVPTSTSSELSHSITSSTSSFSTLTSTPTPTSTPTSNLTSTSALQHSSNIGAIAGGIVGGIVSATLIFGVLARFMIRRRHARLAMSTSGQGSEGELDQPVPYPVTIEAPRLYDPSDPMTYPGNEHLQVINQHLGPAGHLQQSDAGYNGLPEV